MPDARSPITGGSLERDLGRLEAFLNELEPYLLSQEVFWPLDAQYAKRDPSGPRLTVGNVLLLQDRIGAARSTLTVSEAARWRRCQDAWEAVLLTRRAALEKKCARELKARLRLWEAYLEDIEQGEKDRADFAREVRNRVIASRLLDLLTRSDETLSDVQELDALDRRLRTYFQGGAFVWPSYLRDTYSPDRYWFLYGEPREKSDQAQT